MKDYKSNLLNNPEMFDRFNKEALKVVNSLRSKYYSLFDFMTAEDVVMECWSKILRQDISFDESKGCKFESFVKMMVNNRCIDMCRRIRKNENDLSMDAVVSSEGDATIGDMIPSFGDDVESNNVVMDVFRTCCSDFNAIDINEIVSKRSEGYSDREIARDVGLKVKDIKKALDCFKEVVENRICGKRTLEDILYGDEDELNRQRGRITYTLSYVLDDETGICISDLVSMVMDGFSYRSIGDRFGISAVKAKSLLDKYQKLVF